MSRLKLTVMTILTAAAVACADPGLPRFEPPTPTPTPEPGQIELAWASRVCSFLPGFAEASTAWDAAVDTTPVPDFDALRDELLFMASFEFKERVRGASQYLGLLANANTSGAWYGFPDYKAPPGTGEFEDTLLELVLGFEPVLNYAEGDLREANSSEGLEAIHASVTEAREQVTKDIRQAAARLEPDLLRAINATPDCAYLRQ